MLNKETHSALLIPADSNEPVHQVEIRGHAHVSALLKAESIDSGTYDRDAQFVVDDVGVWKQLPLNQRASEYIRNESLRAQQGRMANAPDYGLYGDVLLVGLDDDGNRADVPQRFVDRFVGKQVTQEPAEESQQRWQVGYTVGDEGRIESLSPAMSHSIATEVLAHEVGQAQPDFEVAVDAIGQIEHLEEDEGFEVEVGDRTYFLMAEDPSLVEGETYEQGYGYGV